MAKKTVASLNIRLGMDGAQLRRDVDRSRTTMSRFSTNASARLASIATAFAGAAAAALSFRAALNKLGDAAKNIDQTAKLADRLQISFAELEALQLAAAEAGVDSFSTIERAIQRMSVSISEAAMGMGEAKDSLEELGINAEELNRLSPAEQFDRLADAVRDFGGTTSDQLRIIQDVFGARGSGLLNLLRQGSDALDNAEAEVDRLGLTVSKIDSSAVEEMNDTIGRATKATEGLWRQLLVAFAPSVTESVRLLTEEFIRFTDVIRENREELELLAKVANFLIKASLNANPIIQAARAMDRFGDSTTTAGNKLADAVRRMKEQVEETAQTDIAGSIDQQLESVAESVSEATSSAASDARDAADTIKDTFRELRGTEAVTARTSAGFSALQQGDRNLREMARIAASTEKTEELMEESVAVEKRSLHHLESIDRRTRAVGAVEHTIL